MNTTNDLKNRKEKKRSEREEKSSHDNLSYSKKFQLRGKRSRYLDACD